MTSSTCALRNTCIRQSSESCIRLGVEVVISSDLKYTLIVSNVTERGGIKDAHEKSASSRVKTPEVVRSELDV